MYKVYHEFDQYDCLVWYVYETATEQIVAEFLFEEDAEEFSNRLEKGCGFNGFTPAFIIRKVPKTDINEAFSAEFEIGRAHV